MTQSKSRQTRRGRGNKKEAGVFSKAKDALTGTVKTLTGAGKSSAASSETAAAKPVDNPAAKENKPKSATRSKPRAVSKPKAKSKAKPRAAVNTKAATKSKAPAKPKTATKTATKTAIRAKAPKRAKKSAPETRPEMLEDNASAPAPESPNPKLDAPAFDAPEADERPDISLNTLSETRKNEPARAPLVRAAENPPAVLKEIPELQEHVFPTPTSFRSRSMAADAQKSDLSRLPTEGQDGRFRFQFIYNNMHFIVRVLGRDARGVTLFLEGHLGFVPFPYEGSELRTQLLEVLQFARKQKKVHINLVAEQRISLTAEILIKGSFNPNTAISAAATRLASVKPLIDVIRSLQPYRRQFSDGLGHYVSGNNTQDAA